MKLITRVFDRKGAPILAAIFVALLVAEGSRQLRKRTQPRVKRLLINSIISIPAFSLLRFLLLPVMVRLASKNRRLKWGLNYHYQAPGFVKSMLTFLLLDYSNYLWHILLHKMPLLWRFHVVHHSDPDLDLSTAIRFHFGEMVGSVIYRGGFVLLTGASPMNVLLYEIAFEGATQFHHSNWKLPLHLERVLNKVIVTPRMHGIHHSMIRQETDSNYSIIFSFWDRLHQTIRLNVQQNQIVTGVPSYSDPDELTIGYLLKLPFTNIREWEAASEVRDVRAAFPDKNKLAE
ncbi:sterol desaturase family protein [Flavisolibacter sp. BT320]|nr:sterol desaturase family protein [Flavisolibacter longurius]